jgi:predicted 2-oxoglutarate/Fe(II)-dependent dioxygenase YbiX
MPGVRHFWDFDGAAGRLYGALPLSASEEQSSRRLWVVLDPGLNVLAVLPFAEDGSERVALVELLEGLPPVQSYAGVEMHAPVIILPNVFEPALRAHLIGEYDRHGGETSGFMREIEGKTVAVHDSQHKKRADYSIEDEQLRSLLQRRVLQKVVPVIHKACCFEVTRMERYIVGCYDSENGGHFRAHRDNTTKGTAHRRFALSLNLNDDFDGGELSFPEYGSRSYKMPAGCAVIFSGSLLHKVSPVTRGRRYAFLPFLYDDAAAALREKNNAYLDPGVGEYKAGTISGASP